MKKSLKKSKKIIILSVVLLALFCLSSFKSVHFSPAPTVSAESEQTRDTAYYNLDDLGLNLCFDKVYYRPIIWNDLLTTGSGNLYVDEKTINNSDTNFQSLTLKNYYNQISGTGGELIRFTKDTIIEFDIDDDLFSPEIVAVFDFRDTQNNTYNFIAQFMDITRTNSINFSDMSINGLDFPTGENDDIFTRFKFYGIMLYYASPFGSSYRSATINPCFYEFYERTAENAYSARSTAFVTLVNCYMYNYNGGQTNKFKFDSMICQISGVSYNSAYYTVAQQPSTAYSNDTKYIIKYTPKAHENSVYLWGDSPAATFSDTDGTLYRVFLETPDAPIEITNYNLEVPKENWNLLTVWGDLPEEDGTSINLISNTATGNNIVTEFMELFHISIPIENYVPTPEPEPEPETQPETPAIDYNKIVERAKEQAIESGWWVALLGITLGPAAAFVATVALGVDAATYGLGVEGGFGEVVKFVVTRPIEFFKALLFSIGTVIEKILERIKNIVFGGNDSLFIIVLVVVAIVFIGRDGGIVYYIKNKKE